MLERMKRRHQSTFKLISTPTLNRQQPQQVPLYPECLQTPEPICPQGTTGNCPANPSSKSQNSQIRTQVRFPSHVAISDLRRSRFCCKDSFVCHPLQSNPREDKWTCLPQLSTHKGTSSNPVSSSCHSFSRTAKKTSIPTNTFPTAHSGRGIWS